MKKNRWITWTAILAVAVLVIGLAGVTSGAFRPSREFSARWQEEQASDDHSGWPEMTGEAVLENTRYRLVLQCDTTHFQITDKQTGRVFNSVPGTAQPDVKDRALSEIAIRYYNDQSQPQDMYSTPDAVEVGQTAVYGQADRLRVVYTIGQQQTGWAPLLIEKAYYEDTLLQNLSGTERRRLNRYYSLCDRESDEYPAQEKKYPCLRERDYYLLSETVGDQHLEEIAGYVEAGGYTRQQYEQDCRSWGVTAEDTGDDAPSFRIPVEYRLTDDGFEAQVITDRIESYTEDHTLQSVTLLEYFGCVAASQDAFLIPDGSGALVQLTGSNGTYSQRIYGTDATLMLEDSAQIAQQAMLPVFGLCSETAGFLAIIEGGAAEATLTLNKRTDAGAWNSLGTSFALRAVDVTTTDSNSRVKPYNLYGKHLVYEQPCIRYVLDATYTGSYPAMAAYCRGMLFADGTLSKLKAGEETALFLDFTGVVKTDKNFLGIPYTGRTVLSTVSEMETVARQLQEAGISQVTMRLQAFDKNGILPAVGDGLSLYGGVGKAEELRTLADTLKAAGGRLYLNGEVQRAYTWSALGVFNEQTDATRRLNRKIVSGGLVDIITRNTAHLTQRMRYVTPAAYGEYTQKLLADGDELTGQWKDIGLSLSAAGSVLVSDQRSGAEYDRSMAATLLREALALGEKTAGVMTDGGNYYVLGQADTLLNLPLTSSGHGIQTRSVPFYQMVVHGSVRYAGSALNLSEDPETMFLKSVECGAALYYACTTRSDEALERTDYRRDKRPQPFDTLEDSLVDACNRYGKQAAQDQGLYITDHRYLSDTLTKTVFEDGHAVLVNYGDQPVTVDGYTVPARDFMRISGQ